MGFDERRRADFQDSDRAVTCKLCGKTKCPRGRSAPMEIAFELCDMDCNGWGQPPHPGYLWPGETAEDFGP